MRYLKILLITVTCVSLLVIAILFIIGFFKPKSGGILIDSSETSSVFINNKYVGKTPYTSIHEKGNVKVKIESDKLNVDPYETEIKIIANMQSVVKFNFAQSYEESTGFSLSSDKDAAKKTGLIIISDPDNSQVFIDGVIHGFSPTKTNVTPGKHKVLIQKDNYQEKNITINVLDGYQLTINTKLARTPQETSTPTPTPSIKTYIQILDTPTGFLRVRTAPGSAGEEIAEVKPNQKFLFIEEDGGTGWYKIQYSEPKAGLPDGIQGWVSNQYSKKIEE